jgi:hypothetical protein
MQAIKFIIPTFSLLFCGLNSDMGWTNLAYILDLKTKKPYTHIWSIVKHTKYSIMSHKKTIRFKFITLWVNFVVLRNLIITFLAHLAKGNVSFCHHLASVVR